MCFSEAYRVNVLYYFEPILVNGGPEGVAFYLSKALAKRISLTYYPRFAAAPRIRFLKNLFNVCERFATQGFDVFHLNYVPFLINGGYPLLKSAKRMGVHTILNIHGIIQLERSLGMTQGLARARAYAGLFYTLTSCKSADRVVVNSNLMRSEVVRWYGVSPNKIEVIPNGVELERFLGCDDRLNLDGDPCILCLGTFSKAKGLDILIEAIAKLRLELPRLKLHLIGSTHLQPGEEFRLQAKKEGVESHVIFHDWASQSMVPRFLKSADICVFPSRREGFSLAILEAMAAGVPIIASDIGGIREALAGGKNGMLFEAGNADALSEAILSLYQDHGLREKLANAALEAAKAYSWENIAQKYISLYNDLHTGVSRAPV
jgi:glycosyltransferase involved in cell wall biosynthesis